MSETQSADDARTAVKQLTEGDVIRVPQYENPLTVTHTGSLNGDANAFIGLEFADKTTSADKSLVTNQHSGRVYLTAGTTDKGEVTTIDVVTAQEGDGQ